jgi:hypothetical protein
MDVLWDSDDGGGGGSGGDGEVIPSDDEDTAAPSFFGDDDDADDGAFAGAALGEGDALPELALIDTHVPRAEVLSRIERVTEALLAGLMQEPPRVPPLELQSRRGAAAMTRKRLFSRRDGASCVRLWRVLAECHANLTANRSATQRELYCAQRMRVCLRVRSSCVALRRTRATHKRRVPLPRSSRRAHNAHTPHVFRFCGRFFPASCQTRLLTA